MIKTILKVDLIDSTSDYLKLNHKDLPSGTVVSANLQTNGRGQFDRTWASQKNQNILMSLLLKDMHLDQMQAIKDGILDTLLDFLRSFEINAYFKAPNDIYVDDKKICGILIENLVENNQYAYIVIGIGLNINQQLFDGLNATSMSIISHKTYPLDNLTDQLIDQLFKRIVLCN